jgi:hypothetical protein
VVPAAGGPALSALPAPTGRILEVGPGKPYTTIASAVAASIDNDTIQVQPGTYTNDFPPTITTNIVIEGFGGMATLVGTEDIPNQKAFFVIDANVSLINIEVSGAIVSDSSGANAAAVRFETGSLAMAGCWFHDNQEGILGNPQAGTVTIDNSEFARNGVSDPALTQGYGYTHNLYLGVASLTVTNSYFFAANVGHEFKSRSLSTTIENCVFADGAAGTASYTIDLPNGGNAIVANNLLEKGPNAQNSPMITAGEEGSLHPSTSLTVSGNVFLNDRASAVAVQNEAGITAQLTGNSFFGLGSAQIVTGAATQIGTAILSAEPYAAAFWTIAMPSPWPAP